MIAGEESMRVTVLLVLSAGLACGTPGTEGNGSSGDYSDVSANGNVTTALDTPYVFSLANFPLTDASDSPADSLQSIVVTSLPLAGTLQLGGAPVSAGQEISAASLALGSLAFVPAVGASGLNYASFGFQVRDNGGTTNGGVDLDPTPNTITIDVASSVLLQKAGLETTPQSLVLVVDDSGALSLGTSSALPPDPTPVEVGLVSDGHGRLGLELLDPTLTPA